MIVIRHDRGIKNHNMLGSWRYEIVMSYDRGVKNFWLDLIVISFLLRSWRYKIVKLRYKVVMWNDRDVKWSWRHTIFMTVMNLYKFYLNKCDYSCSLCQNIFRQRAIRQNKERVTPSDTTITRKSKHWCLEIIHSR